MITRKLQIGVTKRSKRSAISLLEVVLALAILAVASAYLAQAMQLATTNALRAKRTNEAELVMESVMNQLIAGVIPAQPVSWTTYNTANNPTQWMYQIQTVPTEVEGMVGLQVAVQFVDANVGMQPEQIDLYANRWIIDPSLGLDVLPEETEDAAATGAASSSGTSSSGGGSTSGGGGAAGGGGAVGGGAAVGGAGGGRGGAGGGRGGAGGGPGGGRGGAGGGPGGGGGRGGGGGGPGGGGGRGGGGGGPGGGGGRGGAGGGGPRG